MTRRLAWGGIPLVALVGCAAAALLSACGDSSMETPLGSTVSEAQAADTAPGDLAGTWILDKDASDLPPRDGRGGMGGGPGGGRGMHGFGGSGAPGGGPGGMHGRGPGGPGPGGGADTLVIVETDTTVSLTHGQREERVLYTDGRAVTFEGPRGGTVTVTASWVEGALVVTHTNGEFTHTQSFTVSEDGTVLTVVAAGEGPQGSRSHTMVYNRS